ncbi:long-chain fatty acid--CoA ligase [Paraconexibacter antarcticus]|uniref:Acyl-CoA synthetase n=1 Tax=Paraconexibacter antarcticus TaxID=2949664 RepID=A0ABY5DLX3_9ACTN|nr:long-chain fatty acid--CoA ligase [Paraconexibacter antarcticus]UTI62883.1 long-chain fatty acid--CoA ligase [Paraconexibacter antarcticus]
MESSTAASRKAIDAASMAEAFRITASQQPGEVAVRTLDDSIAWTWGELREKVDLLAQSLVGLGLERGQTIALMLANRPEFHLCDLAAMMIGATPFSIYMQYTPEQVQFVVSDADAHIIITEPQFLDVVLEARKELPGLQHVVVVGAEGDVPEGCTTLEAVMAAPDTSFDVDAAVAALGSDDILTLIYTSGTTGPPKGVQLTHGNLLVAVEAVEAMVQFPSGSRVISWLPSAHIAERAAHHYLPVAFGLQITSCPDPRAVLGVLPQVRPHWFFAVPRIWEKLKAGLETAVAGLPDEQQEAAQKGLAAATERVRLRQRGEEVPAEIDAAADAADASLFAGWRAMLGLDQVKAINVGAAPTPVEVLEFFHAIGLPLAELWGMSETCGAGAVNPPDRIKIGTVGPAAPGVEIRIAEDGEVLIRGGVVMPGYRNLPEKTAEAIQDGWLHTGDIGKLDEDGYLSIVDRKKEIIINAAGKNMSPANIEATLKSAHPLIGQACCIGDGRLYNTALIVLDADFAPAWAAKRGIEDTSLEALAANEEVRAEIQGGVDAANAKLARVEQLKKFTIVAGDWLPGGDELTPTMKLKRRPIDAKYTADIEAMYA